MAAAAAAPPPPAPGSAAASADRPGPAPSFEEACAPEEHALATLPRDPATGWVDWSSLDASDLALPEGDDLGVPEPAKEEGEEEELEDLPPRPQLNDSLSSIVAVDGLPQVPKEKFDKLKSVISKLFGQVGTLVGDGVTMPFDQSAGNSKGFAFVQYASPDEASAAKSQTDNYRLDKAHSLKVNLLPELERYSQVPEEYQPPASESFNPAEGLGSWLLDSRGRDQFLIRYQDVVEVHWNDGPQSKSEEVYKRHNWTESFVSFSPKGNYIATIHNPGIALWGTEHWKRLNRLSHTGVQYIQFSPGEHYLLVCSVHEPSKRSESSRCVISCFDVRSGRKLRTFEGSPDEFAPAADGHFAWPVFQWAGGSEDRFFARLNRDSVSVYETPHMGLLGKKSVKLPGVVDFQMSPADSMFAAYMPERGNSPARIALVSLPDKTEVRQKNLFSVSEVQLRWHPDGIYFAARVLRLTKTRKTTYTGFELFRVKEQNVPNEVTELDNNKEKVVDLQWEPGQKGHRLAVLHGDSSRPSLSMFSMVQDGQHGGVTGNKVVKLATHSNKAANSLHWSPRGKHLVLAGKQGMDGQLEFFNADDGETMATSEHFMCSNVEWDPTGRYVASSVTTPASQMENGFIVWTFHGQMMYKVGKDMLFQCMWRPRPPSLLPHERRQELWKNLRKYSKRFDEEDEALKQQAEGSALSEKQRKLDEWRSLQRLWHETINSEQYQQELARIREHLQQAEEPVEEQSMEVEELLEVKEEAIE
jgi:translation initiation factor 3 subunit B